MLAKLNNFALAVADAVGLLAGELDLSPQPARPDELAATLNSYDADVGDVRGQEFANRALVDAAAGSHYLLLSQTNTPLIMPYFSHF